MLNSAIGAFFGLMFWIAAARTMTANVGPGIAERRGAAGINRR
jgi:hypothetical protein